jgi:hypothetical protein
MSQACCWRVCCTLSRLVFACRDVVLCVCILDRLIDCSVVLCYRTAKYTASPNLSLPTLIRSYTGRRRRASQTPQPTSSRRRAVAVQTTPSAAQCHSPRNNTKRAATRHAVRSTKHHHTTSSSRLPLFAQPSPRRSRRPARCASLRRAVASRW